MQHENLKIEIEGSEIQELYNDLISLEVELDEELAGMFRLKLGAAAAADGTWTYLDDERLTIWKPVVITAGLEERHATIAQRLHHPPAPGRSALASTSVTWRSGAWTPAC